MQYTVSMTSRMLAIAGLCLFLLCVLLFLLGIELGKRFAEPAAPVPVMSAPALPAAPPNPAAAAAAPAVHPPVAKP